MKFIGILVILFLALGAIWYSAQSLPTWFDEEKTKEQQAVEALSQKINEQGVELSLIHI